MGVPETFNIPSTCQYCNRSFTPSRAPTKQHILAEYEELTKVLCNDCHQNRLNSSRDKIINSVKNGNPVPQQVTIGSVVCDVFTGIARCGSDVTPINFIPHSDLGNFLEVKTAAVDFNQGEYKVRPVFSGGVFAVSGGSVGGHVYVVAFLEKRGFASGSGVRWLN